MKIDYSIRKYRGIDRFLYIICKFLEIYRNGNISVTFKDSVNTGAWAVTEDIKALLPTPFIKMYY